MNLPTIGELKNPFRNGKIVGAGIAPDSYRAQLVERGDPKWVMGSHALAEFARCPHRWFAGYESEDTKQTEWGSIVDCLALTPDRWQKDFIVTPEKYQAAKMKCPKCGSITESAKCAKCKCERESVLIEKPWDWNATPCIEWREKYANGKQVVKHETFTQAENAVKILYGKPETREVLECSERQVMAIAEYADPETAVVIPCKILIDLLPKLGTPTWQSCLGDLKTANSVLGWPRKVWDMNYHLQAAFYLDVYAEASGEPRTEFFHVIQESFPPWEPARKVLSAEFIELGRWKYQSALREYAKCLKTGEWPGYRGEITEPEPWMINAA